MKWTRVKPGWYRIQIGSDPLWYHIYRARNQIWKIVEWSIFHSDDQFSIPSRVERITFHSTLKKSKQIVLDRAQKLGGISL